MQKSNILLYNTATRKKEIFSSINRREVQIYTCGPTLYKPAHIGNLRAYVFADLLNRILRERGYRPDHVINLTDVGHLTDDGDNGEDKIEVEAKESKKDIGEIVSNGAQRFFEDLGRLNIPLNRYRFPKATEFIAEQIKIIESLEQKGHTYKTPDGVYFATDTYKDYGSLGNLKNMQIEEGKRIGINEHKKNKHDFALWKFSPKNEKRQQEWDSPWGVGFPGWSIECSAMAMALLSNHIDIHTGGVDHIYIHHNNEIAQSECSTGEKFVNVWMHSEHLNIDGEKISKSTGNTLLLLDLIAANMDPLSLRYLFLTAHYRTNLTFTKESIKSADVALKDMRRYCLHSNSLLFFARADKQVVRSVQNYIADDLSSPQAIAAVWKFLKNENISDSVKTVTLGRLENILGLDLKPRFFSIPKSVKLLQRRREIARRGKDWDLSDELRKEIEDLGWIVEDIKRDAKIIPKTD